MNILVTGGAGYLGSVLVPELLAAGHRVTVIDAFAHGVPSLTPVMHEPKLRVIREDVRLNSALKLVRKFDVLIPLAAIVGAPACELDPFGAATVNAGAVCELVARSRLDQLILFPCTNSGYGAGTEAECTEDLPMRPLSLYARTKLVAERAVLAHPGGVSLRFATLFGISPRMRLDLLVNDFVRRAVRDRALTLFEPHFRRNFLHVRDAASALLFALEHHAEMRGRAFNAGDSRANMSKERLCREIANIIPGFWYHISNSAEDLDKRDYVVSNARLEALGWRPRYSLQDGIQELARAYCALPFEGREWRNA